MGKERELHLNFQRNIIRLVQPYCHENKMCLMKDRFLLTCSLQKTKKEREGGEIWASRQQECFREKTQNIKACLEFRRREQRRVVRQRDFTANGPHQEVLQRKKRTGVGWRRKVKRRGTEKEGPFTSEWGTRAWQCLNRKAVSRQHDGFPLHSTIITAGVGAS